MNLFLIDYLGKIAFEQLKEYLYYLKIYVKDLRILNRNLEKTVLVDNAGHSFAF